MAHDINYEQQIKHLTASSTIFLLLAIVMFFAERQYTQLNTIRQLLNFALAPIYFINEELNENYQIISWKLKAIDNNYDQNNLLKQQENKITQINGELIALQSENKELRQLLKMQQEIKGNNINAKIINKRSGAFNNNLLINKGRSSQVHEDAVVLSKDGIVGQVSHVMPDYSLIIPIINSNHALPVINQRTQELFIANGRSVDEDLIIYRVGLNYDIVEGDLLYSSGLGDRFPPGIEVGVVSEIEKFSEHSFRDIIIKPKVNFRSLRYVLLINPQS